MKRNKILVILLAFIALLSCIGSVFAYMFKKTEVVPNEFVPATVSCVVEEKFNDNVKDNKKTSIQIRNTSNIEAYLRLYLVTYWIDEGGNILYDEPADLYVNYDTNDWLKSGDIYYYKKPVKPGEPNNITTNLLNENAYIALVKDSDGNRQVVEVFAEAIQSEPTDAVTSAWNVTLGVDSEGNNFISGVNTTQNNN